MKPASHPSNDAAHACAPGTLSPLALQAATHAVRTLAPGQACTLRASSAGELRLVRGSAWVTRRANALPAHAHDTPHDLFLTVGDRLALHAGQSVVLEPIGLDGAAASAVAFRWCVHADAHAWSVAVAAPAQDLRRALMQAGHAGVALARGVLRWAAGARRAPRAADCATITPS